MKRVLASAALFLAALASGGEAPTLQTPPAESRPGPTIDDIERGIDNVKAMIWNTPGMHGYPPPDHTGRKLEEDLAAHVLTEASLASIQKELARVTAAVPSRSSVIPQPEFASINVIMNGEMCRYGTVLAYWASRRVSGFHEDLIQTLANRVSTAGGSQTAADLQALRNRVNALRNSLAADTAACPRKSAIDDANTIQILADYNALRVKVAASLPAALKTGPLVQRTTACPPPAASSGTARARMIANPDLADFYPPEAVFHEVEGRVRVRLDIDSTGCIASAALAETSGAEILDRAGVEYAFGLQFAPAEENGKPVATSVIVPIVFRMLENMRDASGGQTQP